MLCQIDRNSWNMLMKSKLVKDFLPAHDSVLNGLTTQMGALVYALVQVKVAFELYHTTHTHIHIDLLE